MRWCKHLAKRIGCAVLSAQEIRLSEGQNEPFVSFGRTCRTRAWRYAPCRCVAAPRKFHNKCVPSHLILCMKNSGSEESLAVDAARFCVRHNGAKGSAGITKTPGCPNPPLLSSAPDLSPPDLSPKLVPRAGAAVAVSTLESGLVISDMAGDGYMGRSPSPRGLVRA